MDKMTSMQAKLRIAEVVFKPLRNGVTIEGFDEYHILLDEKKTTIMISSKTPNGPRAFTIKVSEVM